MQSCSYKFLNVSRGSHKGTFDIVYFCSIIWFVDLFIIINALVPYILYLLILLHLDMIDKNESKWHFIDVYIISKKFRIILKIFTIYLSINIFWCGMFKSNLWKNSNLMLIIFKLFFITTKKTKLELTFEIFQIAILITILKIKWKQNWMIIFIKFKNF